ncbi:MAG TPA: cupredoxin family copper-binding protein [Candidatus Baltobacteraceae bacterium]|jgi:plastocyanin|nr:cupredoxin family copper-binding protein [Candidatus Baltobacteraceae bacterium]
MRPTIFILAIAALAFGGAPALAHGTYTVHIKDFKYNPAPLRISVGDRVRFINDDQEAHTVTATDKSFDSAGLDTGDSWTYTFKKSGTYSYFCTLHPWMKATVIVAAPKGKSS